MNTCDQIYRLTLQYIFLYCTAYKVHLISDCSLCQTHLDLTHENHCYHKLMYFCRIGGETMLVEGSPLQL